VGRDPGDIRRAINVGLAFTEESLQAQFGGISDYVRPGVLAGSDEQIMDTIGRFVEAGADQVNLALRAPFDLDSLERFSATLQLV
jgi:alkanesulfonate monooxygenase SsuD/methylene tetrahydromethanopterin reductase-like flavin-dependent oxidoreductase (luciferase family)